VPRVVGGGTLVCLVKPQFEVGRPRVGKGGIVRDEQARQDALAGVVACAQALGLREIGHLDSPVHGATGNVELLLVLHRS
jgi:23S rRNA (cytidine1920-2'-O)/16S rRNA (cytidine1409-2'-O)-methyltransferase